MDPIDARDLFWLTEQRRALMLARASGRFPHAILIQAPAGCGGDALCRFAAQAALCRQPQAPCGMCRECQLAARVAHPDFLWVGVEEKKTQISIDQIRALSEKLQLTSYESGGTVAVIAPSKAYGTSNLDAI